MNKIKRITALIIVLLIIFSASAQAEYIVEKEPTIKKQGYYTYSVLHNEATIHKYDGYESKVVVPSTLGNAPVTAIDSSVFFSKHAIKELVLPDTLKVLRSETISGCLDLELLTIPASITTIESKAIDNCQSLTSVLFSGDNNGNFTRAYSDSIKKCENIKYMFFADSDSSIVYSLFPDFETRPTVFKNIYTDYTFDNFVLFDKNKTKLIAYGRNDKYYTVPDSVKIIEAYAFRDNDTLIAIKLPAGLKNIKNNAFAKMDNLRYLSIPSSISLIEIGILALCPNFKEIHFSGTQEQWNRIDINSSNNILFDSKIKFNSNLAFDTENSVVFTADKKTLIYFEPTDDDNIIQNYTVPDTVTEIASKAFSGCTRIKAITIPESVTTIGLCAFNECTSLKTVYAGSAESWLRIKFEDFYSNPMCEAYEIFFNGQSLTEFTVPESVTEIGKYAFYYVRTLKKIVLHDNIKTIDTHAFEKCLGLNEVVFGNSVTTISLLAFYECKSLKTITIPYSVTNIQSNAFSYSGIEHISLHNNITELDSFAFKHAESLKSACLPENDIDTIQARTFSDCTALEKLYIPSNIKNIDVYAFYNCPALSDIYYNGTEDEWNAIQIDSTNSDLWLATVHFEHKHTINNWTVVTPAGEYTDGIEKGCCSVCGYEDYKVTPSDHTHSYTYAVTTPATCLENGVGTYTCVCNDSYTEEITATGHTETTVEAKEPTCTEIGYTEGKKCSVCDVFIEEPQEIPAKDHTAGEWEVTVKADISKEGKEQQKCTVCGTVLDEKTIPALTEEPSEPSEPTEPEEPSEPEKPDEPDEPQEPDEPDEPQEPEKPAILKGDTNGDGKINASDARTVLRISAQLESIEALGLTAADLDMNGDGKVNAIDARILLRKAAQLE